MYRSLDECLRNVYRLSSVCIEPLNNTAQVMNWCETKGAGGSGSALSQSEWHANAAMILARIGRILNRYEAAAIRAEYGGMLDGIIDLTAFIESANIGVNLLICDDVLAHIFTGFPKQTVIQDKYNLSKGGFWRQKKKVGGIVAALLDSAQCKLDDDFKQCGIIQ